MTFALLSLPLDAGRPGSTLLRCRTVDVTFAVLSTKVYYLLECGRLAKVLGTLGQRVTHWLYLFRRWVTVSSDGKVKTLSLTGRGCLFS